MNAKATLPNEPLSGETDVGDLPKPARKPKTAPPTQQIAKTPKQKPAAAPDDAAKPKTTLPGKPAKEDKPPKIKMVRDSFTMPESDYAQFAELKKRCLQAGLHVKKSELLRAGLTGLSRLSDADLLQTMKRVEVLKTGRPAKQK